MMKKQEYFLGLSVELKIFNYLNKGCIHKLMFKVLEKYRYFAQYR